MGRGVPHLEREGYGADPPFRRFWPLRSFARPDHVRESFESRLSGAPLVE